MTLRQKWGYGIVAGALFLLLLVIVFGDNGLLELQRLRVAHQQLVQQNERLGQENLRMYRAIERLQNDAAYIEYVARQELGVIRADETIFKFADKSPQP